VKVAPAAADGFVRKPDPRLRAILVFGQDDGLIGERGAIAAKSVCPDLADPFRVVEVTAAQLKEDPARLADEFAALSMIGGRRVVRVRPADDDTVAALENLLLTPSGDALIVLEAGDLKPGSALRQLAESSDLIAAVACYPDTESKLEDLVDQVLGTAACGRRATRARGSSTTSAAIARSAAASSRSW
jgi:DNA polymerase-3 subunit delta